MNSARSSSWSRSARNAVDALVDLGLRPSRRSPRGRARTASRRRRRAARARRPARRRRARATARSSPCAPGRGRPTGRARSPRSSSSASRARASSMLQVRAARRRHAAREISEVLGEVAHAEVQRPWQSLYFLPLPQKQGSLRPGVFSTCTGCCARPRRRSATGVAVAASPPRILGHRRRLGGRGCERARALHRVRRAREYCTLRTCGRGAVVDDDLEVEDVADEVVLDLPHHRLEHVEALALPLGERVLLAHRPQVDALAGGSPSRRGARASAGRSPRASRGARCRAASRLPIVCFLLLVQLERVVEEQLVDAPRVPAARRAAPW